MRLALLAALLAAMGLTAASLIAFLIHEYEPPDAVTNIEPLP